MYYACTSIINLAFKIFWSNTANHSLTQSQGVWLISKFPVESGKSLALCEGRFGYLRPVNPLPSSCRVPHLLWKQFASSDASWFRLLRCTIKFPELVNMAPHVLHSYIRGLRIMCRETRMWCLYSPKEVNVALHIWHRKQRLPSCFSRCIFKEYARVNFFPQRSH